MHRVSSFLLPAIGVCYVVGRFSKRANGFGAIITLTVGYVFGVTILSLRTIPALQAYCPDIILKSNLYHINFILVGAYVVVLLVSSRLRPAPKEEDLAFMQPTEEEKQERAATIERVGIFGTFKFWLCVYICGFLGVYLLF